MSKHISSGVVGHLPVMSGDGYSYGGGLTVTFPDVPGYQGGLTIMLGEGSSDWAERVRFAHRLAAAPCMYEALVEARDALNACAEYFDNRQDADHDGEGFVPNKEMLLLTLSSEALALVGAALAKAEGR